MNFSKKLLAGAVVAVGTAGAIGLGVASAATNQSGDRPNLVDKIATRFNVDRGEVEAVFEEDRAAHKADMEKKFEYSLDTAVEEGKITAEQKAKILAKRAELRAEAESEREALKDKTKDEMRALFGQRHEALQKWAADNGIPEEYVMMMGPGFGVAGHHELPAGQTGAQPTVMFEGSVNQ